MQVYKDKLRADLYEAIDSVSSNIDRHINQLKQAVNDLIDENDDELNENNTNVLLLSNNDVGVITSGIYDVHKLIYVRNNTTTFDVANITTYYAPDKYFFAYNSDIKYIEYSKVHTIENVTRERGEINLSVPYLFLHEKSTLINYVLNKEFNILLYIPNVVSSNTDLDIIDDDWDTK